MNIRVGCTPDRSVITITVMDDLGKEIDFAEMVPAVEEYLRNTLATIRAYDSMMKEKQDAIHQGSDKSS